MKSYFDELAGTGHSMTRGVIPAASIDLQDQASANSKPSSMIIDDAYSMWSTRLGDGARDFDDA